MSTPASDFAEVGADLLRMAAAMARATRGRFDGEGATVLETTFAYAEAATFAFSALAQAPSLAPEQQQRASNLASAFRNSIGTMATHFARGNTVTTLAPLGEFSPKNPHQDRLSSMFGPSALPLVTVSQTAQDALDSMRRDPLVLVSIGADALLQLMATVAAGVVVRSA